MRQDTFLPPAAGALTTKKRGAQDALPTRNEIEALCRQHG